ncbi:inactive serine/threonine-protein kinase TEX14-like isoform X5 [Palaemon carinicauda]|uniref:inactive serine/threonine-protein kinase TEX14-like isoform X5 n=1 Tax=Palaemon carinicauda TaxID=392227 RepID=UPI0035B59B7E
MLPSPMRALRRAAPTPKEKSPDELHLAVLTGRTKRIKHLLRKGVHIESVNSHGQTPLFCAAFGGDNEVVSLLLKLGANPNRRCGSNGATPVHGAAYRGSRRVLRLLVEAGGDLTLEDNVEQTPREYALKQPSPIRRQKILHFLDLLLAMTLHRSLARTATIPHGTLTHPASKSTLSLKREGSIASIWGACVTDSGAISPRSPTYPNVPPSNLHKAVSCHLLDQMYVSTSLPLLNPADLKRPELTGVAYTCGGPTVYSPYTWLGTNVTVRRPTPALSLPRENVQKGEDKSSPDAGACKALVQELSILRRLRHPAFLEVMAACHVSSPQPDHITLVFQHVPYGSLYHHLHVQHRDLNIGGAVDILVGLVEALLFLHAHGWLHSALSSHSLHLISTSHAKLGAFEFAMEMHGKGCSMKAPQLTRAAWLHPWQAPETLSEQMVSVRSEIYSFTAIMWEIWSGMPPWCGVEEAELKRKVGSGETLPPVGGEPQSLVTYLTEYGLKWNSHERELDLQEIHTMLRSLRIQSNEEDRVPAIPAWGPPSIPNTPVIGRHASQTSSPSHSNTAPGMITERRKSEPLYRRDSSGSTSSSYNDYANRNLQTKPKRKDNIATQMTVAGEVHHHKSLTSEEHHPTTSHNPQKNSNYLADGRGDKGIKGIHSAVEKARGKTASIDSGFSTPCTRTPSPIIDTMTSANSRNNRKESVGRGWDEITGIKPASHQLTRHSSSCSLASGPSSPVHHGAGSSNTWSPSRCLSRAGQKIRASSNHNSPIHSPRESSTKTAVGRRWNSVSGTPGGLGDTAIKIQTRRHSEGQRARTRKGRRRQEVEVEEEFFDDEFNALLFQQPHMQLSVGSSENLLDSRAPHSMLADGSASPVSLGFSSFSPSLTSSEDEGDEAEPEEGASKVAAGRARWRLGAVAEDGNSEEENENKQKADKKNVKNVEKLPVASEGEVTSDVDDAFSGPWRVKDFNKEYEPLKSVQLLKNLEKNLSTYLPTYSIGSDTESGEP